MKTLELKRANVELVTVHTIDAVWGAINGDINNQTDLIETLDKKANKDDFYSKEEIDALIPSDYVTEEDLDDFVTEEQLDGKGYITDLSEYALKSDIPDTSNFATKSEIPTDYITEIPAEYITESELDEKGYLTEHQDLSGYYTKGDINTILAASKFEFVDLGLPSGLKWATCNVGATKPEEYGLYFAWGETEGYTVEDISNGVKAFDINDYKWYNSTSKLTKYNVDSSKGIVDNLKQLQPEDDAVYVTENSCRMPTSDDIIELMNNTTFTWEKINGINGGRFTASNGNSIFIPASGVYEYGAIKSYPNVTAYLCSSTTNTLGSQKEPWQARALLIQQSTGVMISYLLRYAGNPIRPVQEANSVTLFKPTNYYSKSEIDGKFGDIDTILDNINGQVV